MKQAIIYTCLLLLMFFLSSCAYVKNIGIEKRRYMPGLYIENRESIGHINNTTHQGKVMCRKAEVQNISIKGGLIQAPSTKYIQLNKLTNSTKRTIEANINVITKIRRPAPLQIPSAPENTDKVTKTERDWGGALGLFVILIIGAIIGLSFLLCLIFPSLSVGVAFIIALAIGAIVYLIIAKAVGSDT